jgi:hypothetical protein
MSQVTREFVPEKIVKSAEVFTVRRHPERLYGDDYHYHEDVWRMDREELTILRDNINEALGEETPDTPPRRLHPQPHCSECHRVFDLGDEGDADEFYNGHDCEA